MKTLYLTTPIYYPNARPHVGSAYTTIVCDVLARYKRMCGYDVAFLTGTDEHGEKLERAAAAARLSPREFVAEKRKLFTDLWKKLGIENTHFVYTDQPDHVTSVQRMLIRAREHGYIDKRRYEGRYCVSDERYISDSTDPADCDICGRPAELISEENYFFKLSAFQQRLLDLYENSPEFVQPDFRRNEVISFVKSGLRDISVSRKRLKWGIPWPGDPEQVFYVWYDALTSYMTGIGYAQGENGSPEFQKYWRNTLGGPNRPPGEIVHMIGKDILRFHAVYWPAFLIAAYPDQPAMLPTTVFAHGWIYYEQDKMSKSKGNVAYPEPIIDALDSFGAPGNDALRYYLLREAPFGHDLSFSYDGLIKRFNSDLANDLGNLANRTITMINRYFCGQVPEPRRELTAREDQLKAELFGGTYAGGTVRVAATGGLIHDYELSFDRFQLPNAIGSVWTLVSRLNGYLVEHQPWKLAESKSEDDRSLLALVLYTAADLLRTVTMLLYPILPDSSERLWEQLGCEGQVNDQALDELKWAALKAGTKVGKPEPIFPRLDKPATLARLLELAEVDRAVAEGARAIQPPAKEESTKVQSQPEDQPAAEAVRTPNPDYRTPSEEPRVANSGPAAPSPEHKISIEDFAKVDMRVGEILSAEPIPGAKKLLKMMVDIGTEVRQVCAGIAEHYQPEQLVGMKVVLVANLQPRKLRGIESNGMIVAASIGEEGKPVLATFKEDVPKGARLK
jgi:methionyl-tRNA synthetase